MVPFSKVSQVFSYDMLCFCYLKSKRNILSSGTTRMIRRYHGLDVILLFNMQRSICLTVVGVAQKYGRCSHHNCLVYFSLSLNQIYHHQCNLIWPKCFFRPNSIFTQSITLLQMSYKMLFPTFLQLCHSLGRFSSVKRPCQESVNPKCCAPFWYHTNPR